MCTKMSNFGIDAIDVKVYKSETVRIYRSVVRANNKTIAFSGGQNRKVNMKITSVLAAVSVCLLAALPAQANLVINGGFETGSMAPWQASQDSPTVVAGNAHSGTYALELGQSTSDALISQVLTLSAAPYVVDFWAENTGVHTGHLTVTLDGVLVAYFTPTVGTTYHEYSFTVTPTASGTLSFKWNRGGGPNPLYLDDVSVTPVATPVPEPTTIIAGALLLLPFGASTLRILRKTNRTA